MFGLLGGAALFELFGGCFSEVILELLICGCYGVIFRLLNFDTLYLLFCFSELVSIRLSKL